MDGFTNKLVSVNAAAERSPGFVWRLVSDLTGNATSIAAFDDPQIIINMAVWESLETLRDYTYHTVHMRVFSARNAWFEKLNGPHMALWWIEASTVPDIKEGKKRLDLLAAQGPSPSAFTFGAPFSGAGAPITID